MFPATVPHRWFMPWFPSSAIMTREGFRVIGTLSIGVIDKESHLRNIFKIPGKHPHTAGCLFPIAVFVGCVIAMLGKTQSEKDDRTPEVLLHRHDCPD